MNPITKGTEKRIPEDIHKESPSHLIIVEVDLIAKSVIEPLRCDHSILRNHPQPLPSFVNYRVNVSNQLKLSATKVDPHK